MVDPHTILMVKLSKTRKSLNPQNTTSSLFEINIFTQYKFKGKITKQKYLTYK